MRRLALCFVLATTAACAPAAPPANVPEEMTAINGLRDKVQQAFKAGDATAVGNLYTTDAIWAENHQASITGRDAIVKNVTGLFSAYNVTLTLTADETRQMGDFAYDWGRFKFEATAKAEGTPAIPTDEGRYLVLLKKDADGQWRVQRDIGNSSMPMPMPMPAPPIKKDGK